MFSIMTVLIYIPTNHVREFPFLHSLSNIYYFLCFGTIHWNWGEMISHCGFNSCFPVD